jgi:hypothetical protein
VQVGPKEEDAVLVIKQSNSIVRMQMESTTASKINAATSDSVLLKEIFLEKRLSARYIMQSSQSKLDVPKQGRSSMDSRPTR